MVMVLKAEECIFRNRKFRFTEPLPVEDVMDNRGRHLFNTPFGKFLHSGKNFRKMEITAGDILSEFSEQFRSGLISQSQIEALQAYLSESDYQYFLSQSQPRGCSTGIDEGIFGDGEKI